MTTQNAQIKNPKIIAALNELQLDAGTLTTLTKLYEELRADFESTGGGIDGEGRVLNTVELGALQRGIIALAEKVDKSVFELDCMCRDGMDDVTKRRLLG